MVSDEIKKELENQQYRFVGNHSTVKVCHWTKSMLKGEGECYKFTFYGIRSHQCMQMSTAMSCANRCVFCWRGYKDPVSFKWDEETDEPEYILDNSIIEHRKLLQGFGGNDKVEKTLLDQANDVKHIALSLTGEPIIYPKLNDFLELCNQRGISTFLVTNGQHPDDIKRLDPVTQLYISIDAPDKKTLKEIDKPLFDDYWERLQKSLEETSKKNQRTTIRITIIKEMNDFSPEKYADLIKKSDADFIEVKGYVFVGASRQRLSIKNMPFHEEVVGFANKINKYLNEYEIMGEHIPSRVVLIAKKKYHKEDGWNTWLDFDSWSELVKEKGNNITSDDYTIKTPEMYVGISGKGTKDR